MQISTNSSIVNTDINFVANTDTEYSLLVKKSPINNFEGLYLNDLEAQTSIPLDKDSVYYSFTANNVGTEVKRFQIGHQRITTLYDGYKGKEIIKAYAQNKNIIAKNFGDSKAEIKLFDLTGKSLSCNEILGNESKMVFSNLNTGMYIISIEYKNKKITNKINIK